MVDPLEKQITFALAALLATIKDASRPSLSDRGCKIQSQASYWMMWFKRSQQPVKDCQ
jgi:hypothetical protein